MPKKIKVGSVVSHPHFGCGHITEDCGESWRVEFTSGKTRNILKTYKRLVPEPVIYLLYADRVLCKVFFSFEELKEFLRKELLALVADGMDKDLAGDILTDKYLYIEHTVTDYRRQ